MEMIRNYRITSRYKNILCYRNVIKIDNDQKLVSSDFFFYNEYGNQQMKTNNNSK